MDEKYISQEGLDKLKKELEFLKKDERIRVAEELQTAISFGDLSENEIEKLIHNAKIIKHQKKGWVEVGSAVLLTDGKTESAYQVVGEEEANPIEGKLSFKSPLGAALINQPEGAKVKVETPRGLMEYKIIRIS